MDEHRAQIRDEVAKIRPLDELERTHINEVLNWIDSGAVLCRTQKPAIPPQHLVAYFVCTDGRRVLLVDHKKAGLWLPTGGHVEPTEHPRTTVAREAHEELGIEARFMFREPLLITVTDTRGTSRHTDVSLWYVLHLTPHQTLVPDPAEFHSVAWFDPSNLPYEQSDPHMARFLEKLRGVDHDRRNHP